MFAIGTLPTIDGVMTSHTLTTRNPLHVAWTQGERQFAYLMTFMRNVDFITHGNSFYQNFKEKWNEFKSISILLCALRALVWQLQCVSARSTLPFWSESLGVLLSLTLLEVGKKIVVMLQGESIFYPIFSQLFPFDVRYISDAVLPLTYNSTLLCTNVPQQEGQQGLFLCLSYHVPVKEMPHLAQILQTHMMTPPSLQLSQEADTCN